MKKNGQALVVLLIFITVAVIVMTAATLLSSYALKSTTRSSQSDVATGVAESGMENAILRLLRDPSYTGETLTLPDGSATITVTGTTTKTVTSIGTAGNFQHTVTVTATIANGILSISSWTDTF